MAKLTLNDVAAGFAATTLINANNTATEVALEKTLSRDGTSPNQMEASLDMNGHLILNQGNPITVSGFNWEGPWVTATVYQVGDVVEDNNSSYICIVEHTSGVFLDDLAAAKWQVVASSASLPSQAGNAGELLTTDGSNAAWIPVASVALPIGGGTLTGPLNGTTADFTGTLDVDGDAAFNANANVTGTLTVQGSIAVTDDVVITDNLTVSGIITPSETEGILGAVGGGNVQSGSVGEYIGASVVSGSAVALVSGTPKNVTSLALSAGDWDINGTILFNFGATTSITGLFGSSSLVSNTTDSFAFSYRTAAFVPATSPMGYSIPARRILVSAPTTVYLVAVAGFTISTCSAYGELQARRAR